MTMKRKTALMAAMAMAATMGNAIGPAPFPKIIETWERKKCKSCAKYPLANREI